VVALSLEEGRVGGVEGGMGVNQTVLRAYQLEVGGGVIRTGDEALIAGAALLRHHDVVTIVEEGIHFAKYLQP